MSYYDAATAAAWLKQPVHCALAMFDPMVAPPSQFGIYNNINSDKSLFVLEAGHHDYPTRAKQDQELLIELDEFFADL